MYSVRRKQQMLKIRLMGTKSDIRWFQNFLQIDSDIEVLELMATQAAQKRMEKAIGKTIPKKQIKAPVPPIKAKYPIIYNPKTMTYRTILNKSKFQVKEEWNLSGTIEQCIIRYASKLDGDQMNEILLGVEEGMTDEQVKSYFKLPADQMKQYRREQLEKE